MQWDRKCLALGSNKNKEEAPKKVRTAKDCPIKTMYLGTMYFLNLYHILHVVELRSSSNKVQNRSINCLWWCFHFSVI